MHPRPTTRVSYTRATFLAALEEHFKDAPQCVDPKTKRCHYGITGCAIGFALTQEDVQLLDEEGTTKCPVSIYAAFEDYPEMMRRYFPATEFMIEELSVLQSLHDRTISGDYPEPTWRECLLNRARELFRPAKAE